MSGMMEIRLAVFLTAALLPSNVAQERYLSCSRVSEYCASQGATFQNLTPSTRSFGRVGKSGPKGEKGEPGRNGLPGPPGVAPELDLDTFESKIFRKVKDWLSKCQFVFNDSCFLLVGSFGGRYSRDDFQRECSNYGATLANLYGEEHRKKLTRFILRELGNIYKELALGMTYDPQTSRFTSVEGQEMSMTLTWHNTYPKTDLTHRNMFMSVNPDSTSASMGAYNYKPQYLEFGVCEYHLII